MVCTIRRIARSIASGQPGVNRIVSGPDFGEAHGGQFVAVAAGSNILAFSLR